MSTCNSHESSFISNIVNSTVVSVDQIGVVPWALFSWLIWLGLFLVYKRCFESLLIRIGLDDLDSSRLVSTYWRISFALISIPFALRSLSLTFSDFVSHPYDLLERRLPVLFSGGDGRLTETKVSYILLTGFYLNVVCEVCIDKGVKSVEFFVNELFTIFFICTFPLKTLEDLFGLDENRVSGRKPDIWQSYFRAVDVRLFVWSRCVLFGIALLATINLETICIESCKLLYSLSTLTRSKVLETVATGLLALDSIIWTIVFLLILPKYFIIVPINKLQQSGESSQMCLLVLLTVSLCGFYLLQLYSSTLAQCIQTFLTERKFDLETALYPQTDDDLLDIDDTASPVVQETSGKNQENLRLMYHTVKCVIRIRRKLKRIRELKSTRSKSE